ncbi:hypothetical protein Ancab_017282 [Ancistrocladus abbreviatus]
MAGNTKGDFCSTLSRIDKGHFVAYSSDKRRFMIPTVYLKTDIFRELLEAAQEFGLPQDGPIMLPCDAIFTDILRVASTSKQLSVPNL